MYDLTCDIDSFWLTGSLCLRHSNKKRKNVARSRVSRLLQTVSRYIDASMNRDDTSKHPQMLQPLP